MIFKKKFSSIIFLIIGMMMIFPYLTNVNAQNVPDWVKNTAKWYGEGQISETDFLNAIKFLIENEIIIISSNDSNIVASDNAPIVANVIIPNGNSGVGNTGFFLPLNLNAKVGTTVVWINDDTVGHTVQSVDDLGNIVPLFNSGILEPGERFAFKFDEAGSNNYYCTIHPWRLGVITVYN